MIRLRHTLEGPNGSYVVHDGDIERCSASECQWPRIKCRVTVTGSPERTGTLTEKRADGTVVVQINDEYLLVTELRLLRRPDRGWYCPHGLKIFEQTEISFDEYVCKVVDPWPCEESGCTYKKFIEEIRDKMDVYFD